MREIVEAGDGIWNATSLSSSMVRARAAARRIAAMQDQCLAYLPLDRVQRIERTHRLWKIIEMAFAAHAAQRSIIGVQQVLPVEQNAAP